MSSSYYQDLMNSISQEMAQVEKKKTEYENYNNKLKQLYEKINPMKQYLNDAENNYKNGGYMSDGETLSAGLLPKEVDNIDKYREMLNNIIKKTEFKISELKNKITELKKRYRSAEAKYHEAKNKEAKK